MLRRQSVRERRQGPPPGSGVDGSGNGNGNGNVGFNGELNNGVTTALEIAATATQESPTNSQTTSQNPTLLPDATTSVVSIPTTSATQVSSSSTVKSTSNDSLPKILIGGIAGGVVFLFLLSLALLFVLLFWRKKRRATLREKKRMNYPGNKNNDSHVPLNINTSSAPESSEQHKSDSFAPRPSEESQSKREAAEANFAAAYPRRPSMTHVEEAGVPAAAKYDTDPSGQDYIGSSQPRSRNARDEAPDEVSPVSTRMSDVYPTAQRLEPKMTGYTNTSSVSMQTDIQPQHPVAALISPKATVYTDNPYSSHVAVSQNSFPFPEMSAIPPQTKVYTSNTSYPDASFTHSTRHSSIAQPIPSRSIQGAQSMATTKTTTHMPSISLDTMGFPATPLVSPPEEFTNMPKPLFTSPNQDGVSAPPAVLTPTPYPAVRRGSLERLVRLGMGNRNSDGSLLSMKSVVSPSESPVLGLAQPGHRRF